MATDATGTPTTLGIPKFLTSADAPSGNGGNAQMDSIDALIQARVNKPAGLATGDVPVWSGATFVVPSGTRTGNKVLRDDGVWVNAYAPILRGAASSPTAPYFSVSSSSATTDVFGTPGSGISIPGNTLGTQGIITLKATGDFFNNSGGSQGITFGFSYGTGSVSFSSVISAAATNRYPWFADFTLQASGTGIQILTGAIYGDFTSTTVHTLPIIFSGTSNPSVITVDSTVAQPLRFTVANSTSGATLITRVFSINVEATT